MARTLKTLSKIGDLSLFGLSKPYVQQYNVFRVRNAQSGILTMVGMYREKDR